MGVSGGRWQGSSNGCWVGYPGSTSTNERVHKLESQAAFAAGGDDVKHLQVVLVASVRSAGAGAGGKRPQRQSGEDYKKPTSVHTNLEQLGQLSRKCCHRKHNTVLRSF